MDLNHFFGTAPVNGVLPVEIVVAIGVAPALDPPRFTIGNNSFDNNLNAAPLVAIGWPGGVLPPR
jgi:hypothetical protein